MTSVGDVVEADFEAEVLRSKEPVFVDFHAEWCGPCRGMAPAIEQMAAQFASLVKVVKVDIDQCPAIASEYEVRSIPTFLMFEKGEVRERYSGIMTRKKLGDVFTRFADFAR